jgi:hypothetical protein
MMWEDDHEWWIGKNWDRGGWLTVLSRHLL